MLVAKKAIVVDAPVERVFSYLADFRRHPQWRANMVRIEKMSQGPVGVGSTFLAHYRQGEGPHRMESSCKLEVREFVPNERLLYDESFLGLLRRFSGTRRSIEVRPVYGRTRIAKRLEQLFPSLLGKMFLLPLSVAFMPLFWPFYLWIETSELRRIKSRVEGQR